MIPMTAAQRGTLARLRINHPHATVVVLDRNHQHLRPAVRVRLRWPWPGRRCDLPAIVNLVVSPDGQWKGPR